MGPPAWREGVLSAMMQAIRHFFLWFDSIQPAWFKKNSWVNEAGGSAIGMIPLLLLSTVLHHGTGWPVGIFNGLSALYEFGGFDNSKGLPGHVPLDDFGQRAAGSLLVAWLWCILR